MERADTPREVAVQADITLSMVSNTKAVEAISQGPDGILSGLSKGKFYVDMSTMSPRYRKEPAEQVKGVGAKMLDAPVSGSVVTLEQSKLSLLVAGDEGSFEELLPIL